MKTVLLVSDATWVHNDVLASLDLPGRTVVMETDPRRVVATASEHLPSVYLVDMQVGSMGGMAITRMLRDAMYKGDLPEGSIVMLLDRQADSFIAKRAGADSWIEKPFAAQALRAAIDRSPAKA